jgi:hypothetical protein
MNQDFFTLSFDGEALREHEIDAKHLGHALIAMNELMQAANFEINDRRTQIKMSVKAHKAGSFEIEFILQMFENTNSILNFVKENHSGITTTNGLVDLLENAKPILNFAKENHEGITATNDLLDLLYKVFVAPAVAIGGGLFSYFKWLKGKKPDKIEPENNQGEVHIHLDNNVFVTNQVTINLANNSSVRKAMKKVVAPLSDDGIDSLKIKRPGTPDLEITKAEIAYFDYIEEEEKTEIILRMTLEIIKVSFKTNTPWTFSNNHQKRFSAKVKDCDFLNKIDATEIKFAHGDSIDCDVLERTLIKADETKIVKEIIKVHRHIPLFKQGKLFE